MPQCKGKVWDGLEPCPNAAKRGRNYCRWHNPEDESWRKVFAHLEKATPEEKTEIVLRLIEEDPDCRLILPEKDGQRPNLSHMDLSKESLDKRKNDFKSGEATSSARNNLDLINLINLVNSQPELLRTLIRKREQELLFFRANLQGANLWATNLRGNMLIEVNLQGANLANVGFQDAHLERANLQGAELPNANLKNASLVCTNLQNASIEFANFQGANLDGADLRNADLGGTNLQDASLVGANLMGVNLGFAKLRGADLRRARLQGVDLSQVKDMSNIFISGAWLDRTRIRREQFGGAIGEELKLDYAAAKIGYLALKQNFDDLGDYEGASWAYRKERQMEKLEAKQNGRTAFSKYKKQPSGLMIPKKREWREAAANYFKYASDTFVEWLCDYGESPRRVIIWIVLLLFVIGPLLFSALGGIKWSIELSQEYFAQTSLGKIWFLYIHYFLYTLDVFTTASFSGFQPGNDAVKLASGFFAIAGIVLAGLLGFVAGNRIRRS